MINKKTLVIGASTNPSRYSFLAVNALRNNGHDVVAVGLREGKIADVEISKEKILFQDIDTITLYVGPKNQAVYTDYIMNINPDRVIFNPGTKNPELEKKLTDTGIYVEEACTLVLLSTGQY